MWIKITQNCSPPPTTSTATTTLPSITIATESELSCFNDDNENEACDDSEATIHIVKDEVKFNNEVIAHNGPSVISAPKIIVQAKAREELRLSNLPTKEKIAHKILVAHKLFSLAVQADNNMVFILDKTK